MRNTIFQIIVNCLILSFLPSWAVAQSQFASVTILVVDGDGNNIDYKLDSFRAIGKPEVELASLFKGWTFNVATLGSTYECEISPKQLNSPLPKWKARVTVNNIRTLFVISVLRIPSVDYAAPPRSQFIAKPSPTIVGHPAWVVVRPAFSTAQDIFSRVESTMVDESGRFELQGMHVGQYLMTFYRDTHVLATKVLKVPLFTSPGSPIEIDLGSR